MDAIANIFVRSGVARSVVPFATGLAVGGIFFQLGNRSWGQQKPAAQKRKVHGYRLDQELVRCSLSSHKVCNHASCSLAMMACSLAMMAASVKCKRFSLFIVGRDLLKTGMLVLPSQLADKACLMNRNMQTQAQTLKAGNEPAVSYQKKKGGKLYCTRIALTGESKPRSPLELSCLLPTSTSVNVSIAINAGGPCAGKSSSMESLREMLTKEGYDVYFAPEVLFLPSSRRFSLRTKPFPECRQPGDDVKNAKPPYLRCRHRSPPS